MDLSRWVGADIDSPRSTYVTEQLDATRATINMVHNNVSLTVSHNEAAKVDDEAKRRLLASKKLSLVVDLDQTIIHATVDPTVGDWQRDESNPNHDAVKEVRSFLLKDDGPVNKGCWYYIKLRPGLEDFLEIVAKMYELHIYTMGTRQYAKNIADIIDPGHKFFGDRILSRDESGSMTAKNLQRLFPVDTKMVVIIDDRGDVWKWSPNLIKVTPYDFFVGIGDINSSFLPQIKKPSPKPSPKAAAIAAPDPSKELVGGATNDEPEPTANGVQYSHTAQSSLKDIMSPVDNNASPLEQLVAMGVGGDSRDLQAQTSRQDEAITAQLEERPLLRKQKQLEADDAAAESTALKEQGDDRKPTPEDSHEPEKPKHNLLHDYDRELYQLELSLRSVHTAFYNAYAQQLAATKGGRLGKLLGKQKQRFPTDKSDLDLVPDIKTILPAVKSKVLGGTVIVFTGVVPLGVDIRYTDTAILAQSFGARIEDDVTKHTTHLVAARNRTQKVRAALRQKKGKVKIVTKEWLDDSVSSWEKFDETPYLLDLEEAGKSYPADYDDDDDILSESESSNSNESDVPESHSPENGDKSTKPTLNLSTKPPGIQGDDYESDIDSIVPSELDVDDKSPVGGTTEDWDEMNDELADFLGSGSDVDESDGDSVASGESTTSSKPSQRGKKRSRDDIESDGESVHGKKARRKQRVDKGLTSLSQTTIIDEVNDEDSEYGDPAENPGARLLDDEAKTIEGDGWSDFEEEDLDAELAKTSGEDQGEG